MHKINYCTIMSLDLALAKDFVQISDLTHQSGRTTSGLGQSEGSPGSRICVISELFLLWYLVDFASRMKKPYRFATE